MPVYCYRCTDCDEEFEEKHSMSERIEFCRFCKSGNVFKVPNISLKKTITQTDSPRVGKVVDKYIEDTKKEIKKEKNKLRSEEL